jgi:hypothetical protein
MPMSAYDHDPMPRGLTDIIMAARAFSEGTMSMSDLVVRIRAAQTETEQPGRPAARSRPPTQDGTPMAASPTRTMTGQRDAEGAGRDEGVDSLLAMNPTERALYKIRSL